MIKYDSKIDGHLINYDRYYFFMEVIWPTIELICWIPNLYWGNLNYEEINIFIIDTRLILNYKLESKKFLTSEKVKFKQNYDRFVHNQYF